MSDYTLVTGFPSFLGQSLLRRLLETDPGERVALLCPDRFEVAAQIFAQELPRQARDRVEIILGEAADMDLGLAGGDYRRLCEALTSIVHLSAYGSSTGTGPASAASPPGRGRGRARSGQPGGAGPEPAAVAAARHVIDLAGDCPRLRRLSAVSSTAVSGARTGVILEEDLQLGQRFADPRDEALLRAEVLLRQAIEGRRLPATVMRPAPLVGDSRSGEIDAFAGPYALLQAVLAAPVDVAQLLPAQGWGAAPLHLAPVDFVTEAAVLLHRDARAAGLTFHLCDPNPLPLRAAGELVARLRDRRAPRSPMATVPPRLLRAVLRAPGVERLTGAPVASLEALGVLCFFNSQNTQRLLEGTGVRCPPAAAYLDRLVAFLQQAQHASPGREEEISDPLG